MITQNNNSEAAPVHNQVLGSLLRTVVLGHLA